MQIEYGQLHRLPPCYQTWLFCSFVFSSRIINIHFTDRADLLLWITGLQSVLPRKNAGLVDTNFVSAGQVLWRGWNLRIRAKVRVVILLVWVGVFCFDMKWIVFRRVDKKFYSLNCC
jgi:hypothetical protein